MRVQLFLELLIFDNFLVTDAANRPALDVSFVRCAHDYLQGLSIKMELDGLATISSAHIILMVTQRDVPRAVNRPAPTERGQFLANAVHIEQFRLPGCIPYFLRPAPGNGLVASRKPLKNKHLSRRRSNQNMQVEATAGFDPKPEESPLNTKTYSVLEDCLLRNRECSRAGRSLHRCAATVSGWAEDGFARGALASISAVKRGSCL